MPYTKTTWVDGGAPAITAANLNKIESGIETAQAAAEGSRADNTKAFVVETRASDPASAVVGQIWLRTDL